MTDFTPMIDEKNTCPAVNIYLNLLSQTDHPGGTLPRHREYVISHFKISLKSYHTCESHC